VVHEDAVVFSTELLILMNDDVHAIIATALANITIIEMTSLGYNVSSRLPFDS
jgi:hypothetical protein